MPVDLRPIAPNQRLDLERDGDIEGTADFDAEEGRRSHTDDRERHAVDDERGADGVVAAAEAPLPQTVADDGGRSVRAAAGTIVGGREQAAAPRWNAEGREIAAAREQSFGRLTLARLCQVEPRRHPSQGAVEERDVRLESLPHRQAPAEPGRVAAVDPCPGRHRRQTMGVGNRSSMDCIACLY
jgi:hypothetical protein